MKKLLMKLKAVDNESRVAGPAVGFNSKRAPKVREDDDWTLTENSHPVIRTHPETHKKCLFFKSIYVHHFGGISVEEPRPFGIPIWGFNKTRIQLQISSEE